MKLMKLLKYSALLKYALGPIMKYRAGTYQAKYAAKYVEGVMNLRKGFICITLSTFFLFSLLSYVIVYFLLIFPDEVRYVSTVKFWVAIVGLISVISGLFVVCSQKFWIKVFKINEVLDYVYNNKN